MGVQVQYVGGGVDDALFRRFIADEHEPIRRDLARRQLRVGKGVQKRVPRRTGLLASTMTQSSGIDGERPYGETTIGNERTFYLGYQLYGTSTHDVFPRNNRPNPHLRFVYNGFLIYAKHTRPRGIRPNNFMVNSLPDARG
ncbi:MAG TPA: hypothetical protein VGH72_33955 [Pseudonocardia sp.]|jgi:hypothetical protein